MSHTREGKHNEQSSKHLHPQRRMRRGAPPFLLLSTPMSSSFKRDWSHHPSPTMNPPCRGRNLPSIMLGRRRNRHRNVRRHHEARERDTAQLVPWDKASEMGETSDERAHRERRNSRRHDRCQAQEREREIAKQDAILRQENPLLTQNLYPNFARALNMPSEVGVLAQIADSLPRTPDAEGYRWLLT
jgi:hypothetical protein